MSKNPSLPWLLTTPADDVNFKSALERARNRTLRFALDHLEAHPEGNRCRIYALQRELRRRQKRGASR